VVVAAIPARFKQFPKRGDNVNAQEHWFTQRLDHFNWQDQRQWKQRYFVNATWWNPDLGGPIFLAVGGEGAISDRYISHFEMTNYGRSHGALIFVLEHRIYVKSQPLKDLTTANLKYLSSQQALADLSTFIEAMKIKYNAQNSPVITFGGSYPGNLAAWFRLKYPHQTIAAVASSAPVQAELDFFQYLDVVDASLAAITGELCDQRIQQATTIVQSMLRTPQGTAKLQTLFSICEPLKGSKDVATFVSNIMGNFMGTVQYDNEGSPITIETVCDIMENTTMDPLTAYVAVSDLFLSSQNMTCLDCSYANMMSQLTNVTATEDAANRQWTYQTCAEFGYFQTTDSVNQPFGNLVPLSYYTDQCKEAFGFKYPPGINETNNYYGGRKIKGATNIIFVNGSLDPWHALSITSSIDNTLQAIYIEGTAHCHDMDPATPKDPPGLAIAQAQINQQIGVWLQQAKK